MTHYTVLICLDGMDISDPIMDNLFDGTLESFLNEALKPFDENMVYCDCPYKKNQDDDCPFPDLKDCIYYVKEGHCAHYNPQSKWDWWTIGGRWSGELLPQKDGVWVDACRIKDLDLDNMGITWAILTKDGEWWEPGRMGWFGMDNATELSKLEYNSKYAEYIATLNPADILVVVDVHI